MGTEVMKRSRELRDELIQNDKVSDLTSKANTSKECSGCKACTQTAGNTADDLKSCQSCSKGTAQPSTTSSSKRRRVDNSLQDIFWNSTPEPSDTSDDEYCVQDPNKQERINNREQRIERRRIEAA